MFASGPSPAVAYQLSLKLGSLRLLLLDCLCSPWNRRRYRAPHPPTRAPLARTRLDGTLGVTGGDVSTLLGELDCVRCAAPSAMRGGVVVVRFVVLKSFLVGATMLCALPSWAVVLRRAIRTGLVRSVLPSLLRWLWPVSGHLLALGFLAPRTLSWSALSGLCAAAPRRIPYVALPFSFSLSFGSVA